MGDRKQTIIIMTDTQRWDMVNCYRDTGIKTPCLDKLASEGMRCERAYTCQPVCGPARSAIFTGTYPHSNGSWGNSMPLGDNVKTIGQRLTDNGVHCGYIGKYHLDGGDYFGLGRCPEGWEEEYWYDMRCYLEELSEEDRVKSRDHNLMDKENVPEEFTFGYRVVQRAKRFIEQYKDEDFLLVVSFDEPHGPYLCPKEFYDMYKDYEFPLDPSIYDTLENKPDHQKAWAGDKLFEDRSNFKITWQGFFACNSYVDNLIGRVVDAVDQSVDDALVIYTSDHGSPIGSHRLNAKGPATYDPIARIPFIVRQKGKIEAGAVNTNPVSHIDITPTVLDHMGIPIPKLLEGKSMQEELYGGKATNDEVFIEFNRYEIDHDGFGGFQPLRATYDGRYKLCINLMCQDELYDMQNDPHEMENLIENPDYKEIRDKLHDKVLDWMNDTRDPFRGYWWERRSWRSDAREATWDYTEMTRQRENEEYEPRQLDYGTGLEMVEAVRKKGSIAKPKKA